MESGGKDLWNSWVLSLDRKVTSAAGFCCVWCRVQGLLNDRRTMLGELNWIFTAITDTIAWNVLSRGMWKLQLNLISMLHDIVTWNFVCKQLPGPELAAGTVGLSLRGSVP